VALVNIGFDGPRSTFSRVRATTTRPWRRSGRSWKPGCRS